MGARADAFSGTPKGYDAFGHIAKSRFLLENWPHVSWNYSWYSGMPTFQGSYPPGYHALVALVAGPFGAGVPAAMNAVALASMLAIVVGCYATVRFATSSRRWALAAGVLLVGTPALWSHAVETGLFPRLLGMGCTAVALAAATRFATRGGRLPLGLAALATAGALSSHVVVGAISVLLVAGVVLVGSRGTASTRVVHAAATVGLAGALGAYFYLPFVLIGGSQSPFTEAVTELGLRQLLWPADRSVSGLSALLLGFTAVAALVAVHRLRAPPVGLRDKLSLGLDLPWLAHPNGPAPAGATPAVRRWDAWRRRTATEGFPLRLALLLLAAFPCVLLYGTVGYVLRDFPFFIGGLQPADLLGYLAFFGSIAVGVVGATLRLDDTSRWTWPAGVRRGRTGISLAALALSGAALAGLLTATAVALPGATRFNESPADPATASLLSPSWSDQRALRVTGASDSATNVVNAVSRVPQTRGYQANGNPQVDWQVWLESSQLDPGTTPAVRRYLLDWHAVGWVLADQRTESLDAYTADPGLFTEVAARGDLRAFAYRDATPVLTGTSAATVLVVGDGRHYDLVLRALSFGGVDSRRLLTLQGPASVDELSASDLTGVDTVLLYGAAVGDPVAGNRLLRDYVTRGGRLVLDEADEAGGVRRLAGVTDSVVPVRQTRTRTVRDTWAFEARAHPVTSDIDLDAFGPPSYAGTSRWDVQAVDGVRSWARPLLSTRGAVVAAAGGIGRGESLWIGIGLPYHAASFASADEAALLGRLLGAQDADAVEIAAPRSSARFVNSQHREIAVGPEARGVLVKEHFARGWHAESDGRELAVRPAGPGMMYVALPVEAAADKGNGASTVVLTYRTDPIEKVGWAVSLLTLLGLFVALAWRRMTRRR